MRARILLAALSFLVERTLEKKLEACGLNLSAKAALEALKTIYVVEVEIGGERKRRVTSGSSEPVK